MPARLRRPSVGLIPTRPFVFDGETIEPSVSVPMAAAARLAAIAAPDPELDPDVLRSSAYGFLASPPRPLQPLVECVERKLAHSLRLVLPRMIAPASRRRAAMNASFGGREPASASEPAVVIIPSAVAMLSLMRTGMPCSGPRVRPALRSASRRSAIASASGFSSMMLCSAGPLRSIASMRAEYFSTSDLAVSRPVSMRRCRSAIDVSSRSKAPDPDCAGVRTAATANTMVGKSSTRSARVIWMARLKGRSSNMTDVSPNVEPPPVPRGVRCLRRVARPRTA